MKRFLVGTALLAAGLNATSGWGQETSDRLYEAIRSDNQAALGALTSSEVNQRDKRGGTPVHYAAALGGAETLRGLLEKGADVNAVNAFGATPLMFAVNEPAKAALLVMHGANVNAHSKMGRTALLLAAASDGSSQTVRLLLERGAEIAICDEMKVTPLLAATAANDTLTIRMLIERGADVNAPDATGITPLMYAAMNGNLQVVRWLLARGADVNAASAPGSQPACEERCDWHGQADSADSGCASERAGCCRGIAECRRPHRRARRPWYDAIDARDCHGPRR